MTLVQAKGLCKQFGDFVAVDHVSFDVAKGEVAGFLGPNGAGKSTTMKMLTGFLPPDAGSAMIHGLDVATDPVLAKSKLGYLPEGAPAYGDMSVAAYLGFVGRLRGLSAAVLRERLAEMVERVKLEEVWNRRIENLSKGFARRVGIAQALIHDPEVLILDEPTDGLDPNQKHQMRMLIRQIAAEKAIIISTHILEEVEAICSRAIIIADGVIVADKTPEELMQRNSEYRQVQIVVAAGHADLAADLLQAAAQVEQVQLLERRGELTRMMVHSSDTLFAPAHVLGLLADKRVTVHEVGVYKTSLEDVFREITRVN
ncbi:MAG: ABC transporter ATP-binding protein [Burkholderiaceae bacterium]